MKAYIMVKVLHQVSAFRIQQLTSKSSFGGTSEAPVVPDGVARMLAPHGGRQRACQAYRRKRVMNT
jgi:hypothetical protein